MEPILLHLFPASLYTGLWLYCWRIQPAGGRGAPIGMANGERLVLFLALCAHGLALHATIFSGNEMRFGFSTALSLIVWLAICFYWVETLYARLEGLRTIVLPVGALACLLTALVPGNHVLSGVNVASPVFRAHFVTPMLANSFVMLAALHALLMALATWQLHRARFSRALANLPPLLTMEALLFRLIGIAFVLLTLALATGVIFTEIRYGQVFRFTHETVFGSVSWLMFGVLLAGRYFRGWRGRTALRWTMVGFITTMLAYIGSRFVMEVLLHR